MRIELREVLHDPSLEVMNFLNEVVLDHPEAISFAPGRPSEALFDVAGGLASLSAFVDHLAAEEGTAPGTCLDSLGQYHRTNGIINRLLARHLELDEGIRAAPASIMVTVGCQEAMLVALIGLFEPGVDALLVSDPTYIGITGPARFLGVPVHPVPAGPEGLAPQAVAEALVEVRRKGLRPRALYDVPTFNNPLGTCMPEAARRELLELARREGLLVLEDNAYGMFSYDGETPPALKALDREGVVVYLGSFAKTLFPGLRVGFLVADQEAALGGGATASLAVALSRIKSLTTVTTPPLTQAVVGGTLLAGDGSLAPRVRGLLPHYRANRDRMLASLEAAFEGDSELAGRVGWNRPAGGFFLTVTLPFAFTEERLRACVEDFGVIVCPMSFFTLSGGRENQVRLSFSYVTTEEIDEGVGRFGRFVRETLRRDGAVAATPAGPGSGGATA